MSVGNSTVKYLSSSGLNASYSSEIRVILNLEWIISTTDQGKTCISPSPDVSQNQVKCLHPLVTIPLKSTTICSQGHPEEYKQHEDMCCNGQCACEVRCAAPDFAELEGENMGSPHLAVIDGKPIPRQED